MSSVLENVSVNKTTSAHERKGLARLCNLILINVISKWMRYYPNITDKH